MSIYQNVDKLAVDIHVGGLYCNYAWVEAQNLNKPADSRHQRPN